jgi:3'-phosphoadenosine 5'-phosphosulfate sulfotransferase (PAPS reductase)/FAD synthetase
MLHLARKAFYPSKPPFPLTPRGHDLEVPGDDRASATAGGGSRLDLLVHINPEAVAQGHRPVHPRLGGAYGRDEDPGAQAGPRQMASTPLSAARGATRRSPAPRSASSPSAPPSIAGIPSSSARALAALQRPQAQGRSIRVFPLSNWTELDVWQYIYLENIPIVPLYFAKERPVVDRDGALIMVDDERMPLRPAKHRMMKNVRFRTLGCYPLTGAIESTADTLPRHHPGNAADPDLRTPGPGDRPRQQRLDGEEEAGGLFLMAHVSTLIEKDIEAYLGAHQRKSLLRFITCGSVDDGKSTLIGRLLYDSKMIFEDQLKALESRLEKIGTQGGDIDFALLVDGLAAEREQGITIDVAYRFFSTDKRKFIVADTPGHEQYTRNMVTGASTADLAVILIDARKGVLVQTRRHSYLVSLSASGKWSWRSTRWTWWGLQAKTSSSRSSPNTRDFAEQIGLTAFSPSRFRA